MIYSCLVLFLGFYLHAGAFDPETCEGALLSIQIHNGAGEDVDFTGVVSKSSALHLDFGTVVVPVNRLALDKIVQPRIGDLITFFTRDQLVEGSKLVQQTAIFDGVYEGRLHLDRFRLIHHTALLGRLNVIAVGTPVRLTYLGFSSTGRNRPRLHELTIVATYDGYVDGHLIFGELRVKPAEVVCLYSKAK